MCVFKDSCAHCNGFVIEYSSKYLGIENEKEREIEREKKREREREREKERERESCKDTKWGSEYSTDVINPVATDENCIFHSVNLFQATLTKTAFNSCSPWFISCVKIRLEIVF